MKLDELKSVLGFDDHDLQLNRRGEFSAKQRSRLQERIFMTSLTILALGGVVVFLMSLGDYSLASLILIFLASMGFFSLILGWQLYNIRLDLDDRNVWSVDGQVQVKLYSGRTATYYLLVGKERLQITRPVYNVLKSYVDQSVRVYYLPKSKLVLSMEPLPIAA